MPDPINFGNCNLWLDASDPTTLTISGNAVSQWNDKSGNGRNATATTTARPSVGLRVENALTVLDFDGVANTMRTSSFAQAAATTTAVVFRNHSGANGTNQNTLSDVTNGSAAGKTNGNLWTLFNGTSLTIGAPDTGMHSMITSAATSTTAVINIDGVDLTVSGAAGTTAWAGGFQIGSFEGTSGFWNGEIAEIVLYNAVLGAGDRVKLSQYFIKKWIAPRPVTIPTTVLLRGQPGLLLPAQVSEVIERPTVTGYLATTNTNDTVTASGLILGRLMPAIPVVLRRQPGQPLPILPPKLAPVVTQGGPVSGTLATTNANDTSAAAGTTTVLGTLATTNANDTSVAAGTTTVTGALARTNANDTSVAAGTTTVTGSLAYTNANDRLAAAGTAVGPPVVTPPAPTAGGTLSGRRGPYRDIDAELEAILADDDEVLCLI